MSRADIKTPAETIKGVTNRKKQAKAVQLPIDGTDKTMLEITNLTNSPRDITLLDGTNIRLEVRVPQLIKASLVHPATDKQRKRKELSIKVVTYNDPKIDITYSSGLQRVPVKNRKSLSTKINDTDK